MNDLIDKLLKLKPAAKVGITVMLMVAVGGVYYTLFYADLVGQINSAKGHKDQLRTEKASYEKRKVEYLAYRNELNQLQEEQRELLKALPKKAEIPTFLANIQEQAELAGLEIVSFVIEGEISQELYVKIPVRMEIKGNYHQVNKFFKNVSDLRRIVNVEDLNLAPERTNATEQTAPRMRAKFTAATFRFLDQGGAK